MEGSNKRFANAARLIAVFLALLLPVQAGALELGRVSMVRRPGVALRARVSAAPAFFLRVGGVAFSGVAEPKDQLVVTDLVYEADAPDGERLRVDLKTRDGTTRRARVPAPDWLLLPTVKYAASPEHACVTLFGSLQDQAEEQELRRRGARIVNYHPAFDNTLLGLRLLQADILLMTEDSADLPKEDGNYLLGTGETAPKVSANLVRFNAVRSWVESQSVTFSSYVIGDHGQKVKFWTEGGVLKLSGEPYWRAWRQDPGQEAKREAIQQQMMLEMYSDSLTMDSEALAGKYTEQYMRKRIEQLSREQGLSAEPQIEQLPQYSTQLTKQIRDKQGINPEVYGALRTTMKLSAFFRHVKQTRPEAFERLLRRADAARIPGYVDTPTVLTGL